METRNDAVATGEPSSVRLVSKPVSKPRELVEAELDCVAGGFVLWPSDNEWPGPEIDAATYNGKAVASDMSYIA